MLCGFVPGAGDWSLSLEQARQVLDSPAGLIKETYWKFLLLALETAISQWQERLSLGSLILSKLLIYIIQSGSFHCPDVVWIAGISYFHIKENEVTGQGDELGGWDGCQASFY